MAESEAECFSGVKTAQNNKTEAGTETSKQKNQNVKLRKEDVPDLTSRKTRRMHRETAAEMASLPWSQNNRKENKRRGVPEVICAQRHTTNCTSRHNSKWLLDLTPPPPPTPNNPTNARALGLGPR